MGTWGTIHTIGTGWSLRSRRASGITRDALRTLGTFRTGSAVSPIAPVHPRRALRSLGSIDPGDPLRALNTLRSGWSLVSLWALRSGWAAWITWYSLRSLRPLSTRRSIISGVSLRSFWPHLPLHPLITSGDAKAEVQGVIGQRQAHIGRLIRQQRLHPIDHRRIDCGNGVNHRRQTIELIPQHVRHHQRAIQRQRRVESTQLRRAAHRKREQGFHGEGEGELSDER